MANTYTQIHIQVVFAVKFRHSLIQKSWKDELYKYMTAIIQNHDHKVLQINGMPDHIHILIGLRPTQALSDLMKQVKHDSTVWINSKKLTTKRFAWQEGFGAFSYSKSHVPRVIKYIQNQEEHHRIKTLNEEYINLLKENDVDYNEYYIFKELE
ncbi:MAG: IS200/IS605 family transposase [Flavobacteriaceae bacterium]